MTQALKFIYAFSNSSFLFVISAIICLISFSWSLNYCKAAVCLIAAFHEILKEKHVLMVLDVSNFRLDFLADHTNGRAYATVLRLSSSVVCTECIVTNLNGIRPRAKVTIDSL